eukprot:XP_011673092.1 PREDICTED: uncharacterized protein LOC105442563 [Strongylocentrotus purpuratus]
MTSEECALQCLQEESFSCLSFKFRDVHTYNDRKCTLSSQSVYTLDLARNLTNPDLYSLDNDMFTRIDKICDAFKPDYVQLKADCPLPLDTLLNNGRINASFSASSYMDGYEPDQTGLESTKSWIPITNTAGEWWQVCYSERVRITGLVTRGNKKMVDGEGCWVNSFKVDYSLDGEYWWNLVNYEIDASHFSLFQFHIKKKVIKWDWQKDLKRWTLSSNQAIRLSIFHCQFAVMTLLAKEKK